MSEIKHVAKKGYMQEDGKRLKGILRQIKRVVGRAPLRSGGRPTKKLLETLEGLKPLVGPALASDAAKSFRDGKTIGKRVGRELAQATRLLTHAKLKIFIQTVAEFRRNPKTFEWPATLPKAAEKLGEKMHIYTLQTLHHIVNMLELQIMACEQIVSCRDLKLATGVDLLCQTADYKQVAIELKTGVTFLPGGKAPKRNPNYFIRKEAGLEHLREIPRTRMNDAFLQTAVTGELHRRQSGHAFHQHYVLHVFSKGSRHLELPGWAQVAASPLVDAMCAPRKVSLSKKKK